MGTGSPILTLAGLALSCYPGDVKDGISRVLQLLVVRDTASTLVKIAQLFHLVQALMARCRASFPHPRHHKTDKKWGEVSHGHKFVAGSPTSALTGMTLSCCPGEVQSLLGIRKSSPAFPIAGSALQVSFHALNFMAGSPIPPVIGLALSCFPGMTQRHFWGLQLMVVRDSSPTVITSRPALLPASNVDGWWASLTSPCL